MKKLGKIICSVSMALLAGVMITADVLSVKYFAFIDEGINGSGINYSNASSALAKGDAFVKEIMEEGITMLKNTSEKLHMPTMKTILPRIEKPTSLVGLVSMLAF